jgi:hypothetical protein
VGGELGDLLSAFEANLPERRIGRAHCFHGRVSVELGVVRVRLTELSSLSRLGCPGGCRRG